MRRWSDVQPVTVTIDVPVVLDMPPLIELSEQVPQSFTLRPGRVLTVPFELKDPGLNRTRVDYLLNGQPVGYGCLPGQLQRIGQPCSIARYRFEMDSTGMLDIALMDTGQEMDLAWFIYEVDVSGNRGSLVGRSMSSRNFPDDGFIQDSNSIDLNAGLYEFVIGRNNLSVLEVENGVDSLEVESGNEVMHYHFSLSTGGVSINTELVTEYARIEFSPVEFANNTAGYLQERYFPTVSESNTGTSLLSLRASEKQIEGDLRVSEFGSAVVTVESGSQCIAPNMLGSIFLERPLFVQPMRQRRTCGSHYLQDVGESCSVHWYEFFVPDDDLFEFDFSFTLAEPVYL